MRGQFVQVVRVEKIGQTNFTSFPTSHGCHLAISVVRTPNLHNTKNIVRLLGVRIKVRMSQLIGFLIMERNKSLPRLDTRTDDYISLKVASICATACQV